MLLMGESVLSLITTPDAKNPHEVLLFVLAFLSVIGLYFLFFSTYPHDANDHALRKNRFAGIKFWLNGATSIGWSAVTDKHGVVPVLLTGAALECASLFATSLARRRSLTRRRTRAGSARSERCTRAGACAA